MSSPLDERLRAIVGASVPGVAIAIVDPDGVRAATAVGSADLTRDIAASPGMVCPWFSMTKIVTATSALRLSERGVLDLDEPIVSHLPAFARMEPTERAARVTSRHLLQHSAGLANPIPVTWVHPADQPGPDPTAFLEHQLEKHPKLRFDPGTRSSYSNLGTLCLGAVMSQVTSTPFVDLVTEEVLRPLGMRETGFAFTDENEPRAATGYHPKRSPMRLLLPRWVIGPSTGRWMSFRRFVLDGSAYGGLIGPVTDAAAFLRMHLRDGDLDGTRILTAESARAMREITVDGRRFDLGLGWFRPAKARDADPAFVEHLGGGAGFFNVIRLYPSRSVGIAAMGNATKYDIDAVAELAIA
jgi:CubicO group peptidase (beta-lactamase class C family)